jgi:hypothetical protein
MVGQVLWTGNIKITTDLAGQEIVDFGVSWNSRATILCRIAPPRMIAPFPNQNTAMLV